MPDEIELIRQLRSELNEHNFQYHVIDNPLISDAEYDRKLRQLIELESKHPEVEDPNSPTMRVGHASTSTFQKVKHRSKMLSLDNMFTPSDVCKFFPPKVSVCAEPKIDGLALTLQYKKGLLFLALTRGDGTIGDDVTVNARTVKTIPLQLRKPVDIEIRGEVYMTLSALKELNAMREMEGDDLFANARNAASGSLKLGDSKEAARRELSFVAYSIASEIPDKKVKTHDAMLEYLELLGFISTYTLPVYRSCAGRSVEVVECTEENVAAVIASVRDYMTNLDLNTDGMVFKVNDLATQRDMGEGTKFPKWAAAFKFAPERSSTKLLSVTVQIGKTGRLTPVAELQAVELGGTTVQRASLCNQDEIKRLGVNVGDIVFVEKSAEIIPKVMGVAEKKSEGVYTLPRKCPCCASDVRRAQGEVDTYCINPDCNDQIRARLIWSTGKTALDIDGCGKSTVEIMMKNGVRKLSDLFVLEDFSFLKPAAAKKIKSGVEKAKSAPFWRKLSALCVDGVGVTVCKDIAARFRSLDEIIEKWDDLKQICGQSQRESLFEHLGRFSDEIEALIAAGLKFEADESQVGVLTGKVFCITGTMPSGTKRDDVASIVESKGGTVKGAVTKKVHYLVVGVEGGANKAKDADKFGTAKINEEQLFEMMGMPVPTPDDSLLEEKEF